MSRARPLKPALTRRLFLVACLLLGVLAPHANAACFEDWWAERVEEAREQVSTPRALLPIREVLDGAFTAADPREVAAALESLRAGSGVDPLVAAEIDAALLSFELRQGRFEVAAERRARLGAIDEWLVAGPLVDDSQRLDVMAELSKPLAEGPWRVALTDPTGVLPLHYAMYPQSERVALAVFYLRAERESAVALRFGADDRAEVRLNGRTLFSRPEKRDLAFDQSALMLYLDEGLNRVSFLVEQDEAAWLLRARLTAPDASPLGTHVELVEAPDPERLEAELAAAAKERPALSSSKRERSERKLRRKDGDLRTVQAFLEKDAERGGALERAALALDLYRRALPTRDDGRALALARRASGEKAGDPSVEWVVSAIETDPSRRRAALERVLEKDEAHPIALRLLAGYHLSFAHGQEAVEYAKRAREACPAGDAYLEGQQALAVNGSRFRLGALAELERALERAPNQPMLLRRVAEFAGSEGLGLKARRALTRLIDLDISDGDARGLLLRSLAQAGESEAFISLVEKSRQLEPTNPGPALLLARFVLAQGDAERALATIDEALTRAPNNPDLVAARAEVLLQLGDDAQAVALLKSAQQSVGDDDSLSRRISLLEGKARAGSEWRVSLDEALKIESETPFEGDPPFVVLSSTSAFRVQENGLATRYNQVIMRVRHAERAASARSFQVSFSPSMQEVEVHDARIIRDDGTVILASRRTRHLLPDLELRMWYDTRVLTLSFPRLEDGDLIDVRYAVSDRGQTNPIGEGYFGTIEVLGQQVPVLSSRVIIDSDEELPLFHNFVNAGEVSESQVEREGRRVHTFELPALAAVKDAPDAPAPTERLPYVAVSSVEEWSTLGRIYADLIRDQLVLTPDIEELVARLTRGSTSRRETVRRLYEWVIDNTRYVALEFGIHALKPYDIGSVLQRRHGDCKDKASLLVAMLNEAGIESKVALVRTSMRGGIDTTVPTFSLFDHAIVYVPEEELWLDGTVLHHALEETPFADLGTLALPVDAFGEKSWPLMRTPEATAASATLNEAQLITLEAEGSATVEGDVAATGDFAALERYYFRGKDRRVRILANRLRDAHPELRVIGADFEAVDLDDPVVEYRWRGELSSFGRREGRRLSLPMGLEVPRLQIVDPDPEREIDLLLPNAFTRKLETTLVIPPGFELIEAPRSAKISSEWGGVIVESRRTRRGITLNIEVRLEGGQVPVARMDELRAFLLEAREALEQRVIMEEGA